MAKKTSAKAPSKTPKGETHKRTQEKAERADLAVQRMCERSRAQVRAMFQSGCVTKNGEPCTNPGEMLAAGDRIVLTFDPQRKYREKRTSYSSRLFKILFEDNYLIVIDKEAGFLTVPTENDDRQSVIAAVNAYVEVKSGRRQGATLVHRLDRDTSGILVLAKHPNLAKTLKEQFSSRKPFRKYFAIVKGAPQPKSGTYKSFLMTDKNLNQVSVKDPTQGKLAITHYRVLKKLTDCSLVDVRLETGRRNQIRVHFSEKGTPVLGDPRYRPGLAKHPEWKYRRLALHAAELEFVHPVTKKKLSFNSPMPEEMQAFIKATKGV